MDRSVVGVLLAGGLARRMGGGDKGLAELGGRRLLDHLVARIRPQVAALVLNANGDPARWAAFGLPVAADVVPGHPGPLAGILTGMEWASAHAPEASWLLSAPTDAPFAPLDLACRLKAGLDAQGAELAIARSNGRDHPVFGLWPLSLAPALRRALALEGARAVGAWAGRFKVARVDFAIQPVDPFFNANTPEDLAVAQALLAEPGVAKA